MTSDQHELLAAAIMDVLQKDGLFDYVGKFVDLFENVQAEWFGDYKEPDFGSALSIIARLGGATQSDTKASTNFIKVNRTRVFHRFSRRIDKESHAKTAYPLLYQYFEFGHDWLADVWDDYFGANSDLEQSADQPIQNDEIIIPASDRFVKLDHNSAEYLAIKDELSEIDVRELTHGYNGSELDADERDRLSRGLDSARVLWEARQLDFMQIKIGVIMVLEDIGKFVFDTAKKVGIALLVEKIKSYTGLDMKN